MSKPMSRIALPLIITLCLCSVARPSQRGGHATEPRGVVQFLLSVDAELRGFYSGVDAAIADVLEAKRQDLDNDGVAEYLVTFSAFCGQGQCACYVVAPDTHSGGWRLLLKSDGALEVARRIVGGYRELTCHTQSGYEDQADSTFQFVRGAYRQVSCVRTIRKQVGTKWVVVSRQAC